MHYVNMGDESPSDAIHIAQSFVGTRWSEARVTAHFLELHAADGVWIQFDAVGGGFDGDRSAGAAQILDLLGFGVAAELYSRISHGGDTMQCELLPFAK